MPLYLFACKCGESTESLKPRGTESIDCACGQRARRLAIYGPQIGGRVRPPVSERKVSFRQYVEASEQIAHEHERREEAAQKPLPPPALWKAAKQNAAKLMKAGVTDSMDVRPRR